MDIVKTVCFTSDYNICFKIQFVRSWQTGPMQVSRSRLLRQNSETGSWSDGKALRYQNEAHPQLGDALYETWNVRDHDVGLFFFLSMNHLLVLAYFLLFRRHKQNYSGNIIELLYCITDVCTGGVRIQLPTFILVKKNWHTPCQILQQKRCTICARMYGKIDDKKIVDRWTNSLFSFFDWFCSSLEDWNAPL